jgi:hypothetical protein
MGDASTKSMKPRTKYLPIAGGLACALAVAACISDDPTPNEPFVENRSAVPAPQEDPVEADVQEAPEEAEPAVASTDAEGCHCIESVLSDGSCLDYGDT